MHAKTRLRLLQRAKKKVSCTHNICIDRDRQALAQSEGPSFAMWRISPAFALPPTPSATARQNAANKSRTRLETAWGIPGAPELWRPLERWRGQPWTVWGHVTQRPSTQMHGVTHHPVALVRDP
ncbi:uncharacterized protein Triagg1_7222 [Trichoderma aggressivum f. europaeum]|uniref:Uncharacterized protein n=1 Tax=Trichoderma aggressivum f. europaeum TaxID=173218 RepID=A0AAE1LY03_9HYPO|nr:hypothetical protein Triagg1_7222 [Trichoderma aggressivum f. europaeum]